MRVTEGNFSTHIQGEVTNLTHIILITRRDTITYRYTTHDRNLTVDGIKYYTGRGTSQSAMEFRISMAVSNLEFAGFLDDLNISEHDLIAGLFNRAEIRMTVVNWRDTSDRMKTIRGWFGNVTRTGNRFQVEVRSMMQALQQTIGSVISDRCRSDFGDTGIGADRGCNYPINPDAWQANTEYGSQPVGTGAKLVAGANGHGLWDGGVTGTDNLILVSGGTGYSSDVEITAHAIMDDGSSWRLEAITVTVVNGVIISVAFPPTDEGDKPSHSGVTFSIVDIGFTNTNIRPTIENGHNYRLIQPGTSGASEPSWPTTLGNQITDGTVIWETVIGTSHTAFATSVSSRQVFIVAFANVFDRSIGNANVVTGTGATLEALPNGHGLWDGGASSSNVDIISGGLNYQNPTITAFFTNPDTSAQEEFVAIQVGLSSTGQITYVEFAPTIEDEKPISSEVSFSIVDNVAGLSDAGFFDSGTVLCLYGENAGIEVDIRTFDEATSEVELHSPFPFDISPGDTFIFKIGCDKRAQTCKTRFKNFLNFRGEPDIPGNDVLFRINTNL